jgi:circadian clock protein KaiC
MLIRLIDVFKTNLINAYFTALTHQGSTGQDVTVDAVSSLADIWIQVNNEVENQNQVRALRIIKARGMGHETTTVHFTITHKGIQIHDIENNPAASPRTRLK